MSDNITIIISDQVSGGAGTVQTVNDIAPDNEGNVALTAGDIPYGASDVDETLDGILQDAAEFAQTGEAREGLTITFDRSATYWLDADLQTPNTGNTITLSATGAELHSVAYIMHQATAKPAITYGGISLQGDEIGDYVATDPATLNEIMITYLGANLVKVAYVQNVATPVADEIDYDNTTSGLTATDVQAAIDELDAEKIANVVEDTTPTLGGDLDAGNFDITNITDIEIQGQAYSDGEVDNGNSGTSDTINWTAGNFQKSTVTGACVYTFTAPTGPTTLILKLVNGGSASLTWPASVYWPSATEPTWTTSGTDIISFYYDGTNYHGAAILDSSI